MGVSFSRRSFSRLAAGAAALPFFDIEAAFAQAAEVRIGYGTVGANRHPHQMATNFDVDIARQVFDGLVALDADGGVVKVLAESYEQIDANRWRFKLRPGVKFHDGAPFGADDVVTSFKNFQRPEVSYSYFYSGWFAGPEKVDDLTVDLVTNRPTRLILPIIAHTGRIIPRTATDPRAFEQAIVGTGRYRLVEFVPNNRVILERNDAWWGAEKPALRRLTIRHLPENATRLAALEAGEIDFAANVPVDEVPRLRQRGYSILTSPAPRNIWIGYNFASDAPVKDIRVRRALNHAVDRAAINDAVYGGLGVPAVGPISKPTRFSQAIEPAYPFDPAKAKQMLAEAGFARGFDVTFAAPNGRYPKDREIAEIVASQLEQVGLKVKLVTLEWATYTQQMRAERATVGRQYGLFMLGWSNPIRDPDQNLIAWDSQNVPWNLGGYTNPELDAILLKGRETFDEAVLPGLYKQAQEIVWRNPPGIFLFDHPNVNAMAPRLTGIRPRGDEAVEWELARV